MTDDTEATRPAVLTLAAKCTCGAVNLSVCRVSIDRLSRGGTGAFDCPMCELHFRVRAASTELAAALFPEMLPSSKSGIWINKNGPGATGGDAH